MGRVIALALLFCAAQAAAEVERLVFEGTPGTLIVEVLDDDLVHVEVTAGGAPDAEAPIYTSPMVLRVDWPGPSALTLDGNVVETPELRLRFDAANLCIRVEDRARGDAYLTTICPDDLHLEFKGLNIDPTEIAAAYGLGQQLTNPGSADGDLIAHGVREGEGLLGNGFSGFEGGAVGNVQIPVLYALGEGPNFALMLDNVYHQRWDFTAFWWQVRMFGDQVRFYILAGPDLPDLRADYLELTGRPPVPPRKAFGLWVSEFGYDGWDEIDALRDGLRAAEFPVDGFVLDLNWFGGVVPGDPSESEMGRLDWDQDQEPRLADNPYFFPDPAARITAFAADGIGLTAIEESYVADTTATFVEMPPELSAWQRRDGTCDADHQLPATGIAGFWGVGRMIDWSDPAAGAWIHAERRDPNLSELGITAHWTDLGEPESFDAAACFDGVEPGKTEHPDVHNLYNLLWNRSVWEGYRGEADEPTGLGTVNPRPFIVTRSGTAGAQRFGAAMWSGDIGSNLPSFAAHLNAQMHMSMSGIDYYGSDIGGFRRETMPGNDRDGSYRGYEDELYTQWFANGAWFDVPVRPHTDNEFVVADPPYDTAPHLVGHLESNRANLRQRYELIPYYYSLAWRAHLFGEPVVPPLVFWHQDDPAVRRMGHEKLIGRDLLVAVVARHGEYERDVYLPAGRWANYHTNEWHEGPATLADVPVYRDGLFRLPAFARAGAILPKMPVDGTTRDAFGDRLDGTSAEALVLRVYAGDGSSDFKLYEDDGVTLGYRPDGRPEYHHRTTEITRNGATVTVAPAADVGGAGPYPGAVTSRATVVEYVADGARATGVTLDGTQLPEVADATAFAAAESGWRNAGPNLVLAKAPPRDVYGPAQQFAFELAPAAPKTSVAFACDRGVTVPGESIYVAGSLPALGDWNPARAVRLEPNVYHDYIVAPPPGGPHPGPSVPVWTGVLPGLPPDTAFEWKCLRRREDGFGAVEWEPGANSAHTTTAAGYSGRSYGTF